MSKVLTQAELRALAMHEIMKREQVRYQLRVAEQRKIAMLSDEKLKEIVDGAKVSYE